MEFKYGKAPMYYIDGVPGYKAGEWPGIKSCKFGNTRRIIRPVDQGIIFNEKEPLVPPRRKLLGPGPSEEYVFRPSIKKVLNQTDRKDKPQGIKVVTPIITINKWDPEKRHKFGYMEEKAKEMKEHERKMTMSHYVRNEMKLLEEEGGFVKKRFNMTNRDLFGTKFNRVGHKIEMVTEDLYNDKHQRAKEHKRDMEYVNNLNTWENRTLSKFTKTAIKEELPTSSGAIANTTAN